jgi:hypothetical protein
MLQAELAGHGVREVVSSEDYLTSAVFGLLKYVRPNIFWPDFVGRATRVHHDGMRVSLKDDLHIDFSNCDHASVFFWQAYAESIPDLTIRFVGKEQMILLIEVKLESDKGSAGDPDLDQLARYARLAQRFTDEGTKAAVAYLTVGDPMPDIEESIAQLKGSQAAERIYGIQWGDVHDAALVASKTALANETECELLGDVAAFLRRRNLNHFSGWRLIPNLPLIKPLGAQFAENEWPFELVALPEFFEIKRGGWIYGH